MRKFIYACTAVSVLLFTSCDKKAKADDDSDNAKTELPEVDKDYESKDATPRLAPGQFHAERYTLTGKVAGKDAYMIIDVLENGNVQGGYHYGKGTSTDLIDINGISDNETGEMQLTEVYNDMITGTWTLQLTPDKLVGSMVNYRGNEYKVDMNVESREEVVVNERTAPETNEIEIEETVVSASSDTDVDKVLDKYEQVVKRYRKLLERASSGDISAIDESQEIAEELEDITKRLANVQGEMTSAQLQRMARIASMQ